MASIRVRYSIIGCVFYYSFCNINKKITF